MKESLIGILRSYSSILFLDSRVAAVIVLFVTFINPNIAISGVLAIITVVFFRKLVCVNREYLTSAFIYNPLLSGMAVGFIFPLSLESICLIVISAIITFILTFLFNKLLSVYRLPVLSLPFAIGSIIVYLACTKYHGHLGFFIHDFSKYDINLPLEISGFLKSLGSIFFLANNIAGLVLLLLILFFSRIMFTMALVGYYFGVFIHGTLINSYTLAFHDMYAFNYILVSIAICGIFLIATLRNFLIALIAVAVSVIIADGLSAFFYHSIPVFTLPFSIVVISFIFILYLIGYKEFNYKIETTPEKSLLYYLNTIFRFGTVYTKISLPFAGKWTVYQSFDDDWTHKGPYKFAYDFVKQKDGKTYINDKTYLENYLSFGESILSPVEGYVIACRHDLIDNPIGLVDKVNNWGNYILLKSNSGFFVEISHIMQFSLKVKIGDYVKVNDILAKCGNSGYSPEPHIHIQVQSDATLGSATREFCFREYLNGQRLHLNSCPSKYQEISSVIIDRGVSAKLHFILDDKFRYDVFEKGLFKEEIILTVKMSSMGEFYLEDEHKNQLYFYNDINEFYFYNYIGKDSYLKQLFILAPRIPYINNDGVLFDDFLPVGIIKSSLQTKIIGLISSINKSFSKFRVEYKYADNSINSVYGKVSFDLNYKGFKSMEYKNIKLERVL
ncbi:urea transporter [Francisella sciaenopsi]|uniref:M23ase beta-sheet core domain-containing protein n=1 Tax=Francisella sciaenopsi TaxID=3055034 RepID=A0ABQ6PFD1_9GAMM